MPHTSYPELQCGPDTRQSAPVPIRIFVWSNQMELKICACCGQSFHPRPQVQNQSYCSTPSCQRERRRAWQRQKLQNDPFYRENQQDAQRAWRERNPNYSRHYRATNLGYTDRNRAQQRSGSSHGREFDLSKMDVSIFLSGIPAGIYRIRPVLPDESAKMDAWIVEISPVCCDCPCKTDACKDRT